MLGAGDTFRAAAVEQLTIWAERLGVRDRQGEPGSDPASVAHAPWRRPSKDGADVCIVDTAGRLQTQKNLMQELTKIQPRHRASRFPRRRTKCCWCSTPRPARTASARPKALPKRCNAPASSLAKLDGTAKGGVVVPIRQQVGLPVKYVGVGEKAEDLALFHPDAFVDALFTGLSSSPSQ